MRRYNPSAAHATPVAMPRSTSARKMASVIASSIGFTHPITNKAPPSDKIAGFCGSCLTERARRETTPLQLARLPAQLPNLRVKDQGHGYHPVALFTSVVYDSRTNSDRQHAVAGGAPPHYIKRAP